MRLYIQQAVVVLFFVSKFYENISAWFARLKPKAEFINSSSVFEVLENLKKYP